MREEKGVRMERGNELNLSLKLRPTNEMGTFIARKQLDSAPDEDLKRQSS